MKKFIIPLLLVIIVVIFIVSRNVPSLTELPKANETSSSSSSSSKSGDIASGVSDVNKEQIEKAKEEEKLLKIIVDQLFVLNLDFKAGYNMAKYKPEIRIYKSGEGIFDPAHQKVKNDYVWNIDYQRAKEEGVAV
jgi:ABC-type dipeptide/oligopeptide/nickel transport system permease component